MELTQKLQESISYFNTSELCRLQTIIDCCEFNKFAKELKSPVRADGHLTTCFRTSPCNCQEYIRCPDHYFLGARKFWVEIRMCEQDFWHEYNSCKLVEKICHNNRKYSRNKYFECSGCKAFQKYIRKNGLPVDETTTRLIDFDQQFNRIQESISDFDQKDLDRLNGIINCSVFNKIAMQVRSPVRAVIRPDTWHLTGCNSSFCDCKLNIYYPDRYFIKNNKELVQIEMGGRAIWHDIKYCKLIERLSSTVRLLKDYYYLPQRRCPGCKEFQRREKKESVLWNDI